MDQIEDKSKKKIDKEEKKILDEKQKKLATKKARITKEYNKLVKLFDTSSKEKSHVIKKLCARASFLLILSEDIEKDINNDDLTVTTINASQQFVKANPLMKDYRDTVKSYQTVVKQLCDLTKTDNNSSPEKTGADELESFLNT